MSDLLTPTLQESRSRGAGPPPFRIGSQIWVALFGGALSMFAIGMVNAARLELSQRQRRLMLYLGLAATVLTVAIYIAVFHVTGGQVPTTGEWPRTRVVSRYGHRAVALLLWLAYSRIQRPADRSFQFGGGEHASLWKPGLLVVLGGGLVQLLLYFIVSMAMRR